MGRARSIAGSADRGAPGLSVAIVNFNSWPDTGRLVGSLAAMPEVGDGRVEVVVVDNASDDPPPEGLAATRGVRLIVRPDNGGFAAGVNTAWAESRAGWLLLLNPDVLVPAGFLGLVLGRAAAAESAPGRVGVVGFALRNEDGSRQPSVGPFPSLVGCVREAVTPRERRKYRPVGRVRGGPVPWVTGACMLVRSSLLDELGGMDEEFFLYHEEVALCRSARDRGWSVTFDEGAAVVHLRPLQGRAVSPLLRVLTRHSKLLYFLKHRPRWEFAALAAVVGLEAAVRAGWCRRAGRHPEARAWRAVGRIARSLGPGRGPRGTEVLAIAERAVAEARPAVGRGPHSGRRRIRLDRADRCG